MEIFFRYQVDSETETILEKLGESETNLFFLLSSTEPIAISLQDLHIEHHLPIMILVEATASDSVSRGTVFQFSGTSLNPYSGLRTAPYFIMELIPSLPGKMSVGFFFKIYKV